MEKNCCNCNTLYITIYSESRFCSRSCSASYNNKGVRRHGSTKGICIVCGSPKKSSKRIYCSTKCSGLANETTPEHKRASNAAKQARYREKQYRKPHITANPVLIKEFYRNCPDGYEVDHIIPLSKGGLHHQDNLQYLTKEQNRKKSNKMVGDDGTDPSSDRYEQPASP